MADRLRRARASCCASPRRSGRSAVAHAIHALGAVTLALVGALARPRRLTAQLGRFRERLAVARLAGRAGGDAAAAAAAGDGARLAGARAARGVSDQRRRGARRRPLALDAGRQRRLRRVGGAAAVPAVAQSARHRRRHRPRRDPALAEARRAASRRWSLALAAGAGFVWLNAILVRSFHHYAGVPYHFDAWLDSLAVQTGITLLWTAIALVTMWLARDARGAAALDRRARRLLAAVVLKLLWSISRAAARDADRLVHRRRRADARHRLRRAAAGARRSRHAAI